MATDDTNLLEDGEEEESWLRRNLSLDLVRALTVAAIVGVFWIFFLVGNSRNFVGRFPTTADFKQLLGPDGVNYFRGRLGLENDYDRAIRQLQQNRGLPPHQTQAEKANRVHAR